MQYYVLFMTNALYIFSAYVQRYYIDAVQYVFSVQKVVKRSEGAGRNEEVQWAMYIVQCGMGNGQCAMGISGIDFDAIVQVRWTQ